MFKELIATAILSFSIGSRSADNVTPNYNNTWFNGSYVISDTIDFNECFNALPSEYYDTSASINFDFTNTCFVYSYEYNYFGTVQELTITVEDFVSIDFVYGGDRSLNITIDRADTFNNDLSNDTKYFVFYFPQSYSCTVPLLNWFMSNFTAHTNQCMYNYTGWYTFNAVMPNVSLGSISLMGNFSIDNSFYNYIDFQGIQVHGYFYSLDYNVSTSLKDNTGWHTRRDIYCTDVVMPLPIKSALDTRGTFGYVQTEIRQDSFEDLFLSIADTPVKLLTDMFNFDLLGMNFGYAIVSILTLLIIVVVLKKII